MPGPQTVPLLLVAGFPRITRPRQRRNAVVLADRGDVAQATKVLAGALRRAPDADPSLEEAQTFLAELQARQSVA